MFLFLCLFHISHVSYILSRVHLTHPIIEVTPWWQLVLLNYSDMFRVVLSIKCLNHEMHALIQNTPLELQYSPYQSRHSPIIDCCSVSEFT